MVLENVKGADVIRAFVNFDEALSASVDKALADGSVRATKACRSTKEKGAEGIRAFCYVLTFRIAN